MHHTTHRLLVFVLAALSLTSIAQAGYRDAPPALAGWTHAQGYSGDDTLHGIQLSGEPIIRSSPTIAEIDGNTGNKNEVAVGGQDGRLYVYGADGTKRWEKTIPGLDPSCVPADQRGGNPLIAAAPAVGYIDGDGVPEVVIGYGSGARGSDNCAGGVAAFNGADGTLKWNFTLRDKPWNATGEDVFGVWSSPALADTDGDGKLEIAFGGFDRNFYLLNYDGSIRWYYHTADTVWSSPFFMNVDTDPELEVVFGTDISANPVLIPPTPDGGFVQAFDTAPRNPSRIEFQQTALTSPPWVWRTTFDQVIYSSPAAGELLETNPGLEIAVGAGCYFPTVGASKRGRWVKILSASTGQVLQTLNAPECVNSSPALGDIDEDGKLEIVVNVGSQLDNGIEQSQIIAWDPENPAPKWAKTPISANFGGSFNDASGGDLQSPVIADIDGNGSLEVLSANFWSIQVLEGKTGNFLTCQSSPGCGSMPALFAWGTVKATPAIGDVNLDGKLDVVMGGMHAFDPSDRGHLYAWTGFAGVINSKPGTHSAYSAPWPQFHRNATHNALLSQPALHVSSNQLNLMVASGGEYTQDLDLSSVDGSNLQWTLSEVSDPNNLVEISVASGDTASSTKPSFMVELSDRPSGSYSANLQITAPGVTNIPLKVNVMVVDTLFRVMVPLVRR